MDIFHDDEGINWYNVVAVVGWSMFALGVGGELLGWWNQLGEILAVSGSTAGVLSPLLGAGRRQVRAGFVGLDQKLGGVDRKLDLLDSMDRKLDAHTELLRDIRDILRDMRDQRPGG